MPSIGRFPINITIQGLEVQKVVKLLKMLGFSAAGQSWYEGEDYNLWYYTNPTQLHLRMKGYKDMSYISAHLEGHLKKQHHGWWADYNEGLELAKPFIEQVRQEFKKHGVLLKVSYRRLD